MDNRLNLITLIITNESNFTNFKNTLIREFRPICENLCSFFISESVFSFSTCQRR